MRNHLSRRHHTPKLDSTYQEMPDRLRLLMHLRGNGITDTHVLAAIENTPRDIFVEETFRSHAYEDTALPISCGQTISQPLIVAEMTQSLELNANHRVLEIGTGSGYQAAILCRIARRVYTIERHAELLMQAEARFKKLKLTNIMAKCGDGSKGWKEGAPFDRIIVTAAAKEVPQPLLDQLAPGGIMIIPVGESVASQVLLKITKAADGHLTRKPLMGVRFVPLVSDNVLDNIREKTDAF
jgi:protein-L-isoaspartate(D-aspartate) O-methyltransferase